MFINVGFPRPSGALHGCGTMVPVNALARVFGFGLLQSIASRLPAGFGVAISVVLVLVADLLPLWPLLTGAVRLPDLLIYYCLALFAGVGVTIIRLRTHRPGGKKSKDSGFFLLHYSLMVGIFALVGGVWAIILANLLGLTGGWLSLLPMALAILIGNAWSLADGWFVRRGRDHARLWQIVLPGYLILVPYLLATVFGAVVGLAESPDEGQLRLVAICLVIAQTLIDLVITLIGAYIALSEPPGVRAER